MRLSITQILILIILVIILFLNKSFITTVHVFLKKIKNINNIKK